MVSTRQPTFFLPNRRFRGRVSRPIRHLARQPLDASRSSSPEKISFRMPRGSFHLARSNSKGNICASRSSSANVSLSDIRETRHMSKDMDPQTGNKMVNQYMVLQELGRGVYGKVKLVMNVENNEYLALKIVQKQAKKKFGGRSYMNHLANAEPGSNPYADKLRREVAIMKKCDHPNVVRLREVIDDPASNKIYLGPLFNFELFP
jgi:serine/threonine protein kinase